QLAVSCPLSLGQRRHVASKLLVSAGHRVPSHDHQQGGEKQLHRKGLLSGENGRVRNSVAVNRLGLEVRLKSRENLRPCNPSAKLPGRRGCVPRPSGTTGGRASCRPPRAAAADGDTVGTGVITCELFASRLNAALLFERFA